MTVETENAILARLDAIDRRLEHVEERLSHTVTRSDVFQSVLAVHGFTAALIVGVIVVLNVTVGIGG